MAISRAADLVMLVPPNVEYTEPCCIFNESYKRRAARAECFFTHPLYNEYAKKKDLSAEF